MKVKWSKAGEDSLKDYYNFVHSYYRGPRKSKKLKNYEGKDDIHKISIKDIGKLKEHPDSIFPNKNGFKFNNEEYKMFAHSGQNFVIFYDIEKDKNDEEAVIQNAQHFNQLQKELNAKKIQPLPDDDVDPDLMLEYLKTERQILIDELDDDEELDDDYVKEYEERTEKLEKRSKEKHNKSEKEEQDNSDSDKEDDNDDEGEETEITDPDTGKKVKKKKHKGERGGYYYLNDEGTKIYPPEWNKHQKKNESKLISLSDYITENTSFIPLADYMKQYLA